MRPRKTGKSPRKQPPGRMDLTFPRLRWPPRTRPDNLPVADYLIHSQQARFRRWMQATRRAMTIRQHRREF